MAPNARFSTPVAWYSTTTPTPESAYTLPSASPRTMYGLRKIQSTPNTVVVAKLIIGTHGRPDLHSYLLLAGVQLELLLQRAGLCELRVDIPDREALVLGHHRPALVGDRDVGVVRDVILEVANVPRLAEHARLDVLERPHGVVVGLRRDVALDAEERLGRKFRVHEAHLAECLGRDARRVLVRDLQVQLLVRRAVVDVAELLVDVHLAVELRELLSHVRIG